MGNHIVNTTNLVVEVYTTFYSYGPMIMYRLRVYNQTIFVVDTHTQRLLSEKI